MAVKNFMPPYQKFSLLGQIVSVETLVQSAVSIAVFFVLVWFAVFLRGLWAPKASAKGQRLQNPSGVQKQKKGARTKKGKKPRGPSQSKFEHGLDATSEEELEDAKVRSSSDIEAPSMPSPTMSFQDAPGTDSEEELDDAPPQASACLYRSLSTLQSSCDIEAPLLPLTRITAEEEIMSMCSKSLANEQKPLITTGGDVVHNGEEIESKESRPQASSHLFAPEDRIYAPSLLLMHRQIAVRIARGAPGLDHPPTDSSSTDAVWCCVR